MYLNNIYLFTNIILAKHAKYDVLMNMDDDDYYFPHSVKTRAKLLTMYPEISMIGCGIVCCYNIKKKSFYTVGSDTVMAEATMMYKKSMWEERHWNPKVKLGEGVLFLRERKQQCMILPYTYVLFVFNHNKNITSNLRNTNDETAYIYDYEIPKNILKLVD